MRVYEVSQTELAHKLGVTHAALNRWLHNKATPHLQTIDRIKELYQKVAFYEQLEKTFAIQKWQKKFHLFEKSKNLEKLFHRKDEYDDSLLRLTYHTNKIEGSTLSLRETQQILFDNRVISKHPMVEHLEVSNHRLAFQLLLEAVQEKTILNCDFILKLHQILMNGILMDAGQFRLHPVRIVGSRVIPPNYVKVPEKIAVLCEQMAVTEDPIGAIMHHAWFEAIHPFSDGNGRVGRLLLNYQLLRAGYPLVIIRSENKGKYYDVLEQAQVENRYEPLVEFVHGELG